MENQQKITINDVKKRITIIITASFILAVFMAIKGNTFSKSITILISFAILLSIICTVVYLKYSMFTNDEKNYNNFFQVVDFISMFTMACLIFQLFFTFCFFRATVDGSSMYPTLQNNDVLIVRSTKRVSNFDIVVVRVDTKYNILVPGVINNDLLVKRVIGLPGDTFYFEDNVLYLNGEKIDEKYIKDENGNYTYMGNVFDFSLQSRCNIKGVNVCDDDECVIPDDYYFVMGDNRTNSSDSRVFGLFHKSQLMGIVKYHVVTLFDWKKVQ